MSRHMRRETTADSRRSGAASKNGFQRSGRARILRQVELLLNLGDNLRGRGGDFNGQRVPRFFQVSELAGQNLPVGVVAFAQAQAFSDQLCASFQVDEMDFSPNF